MKKTTKNEKKLQEMGMNFSVFTPTEAVKIFKLSVSKAKLKSGAYKTYLKAFEIAETKELLKYLFKYKVNNFSFEELDELIKNIEYVKEAKKNAHKNNIKMKIAELQKQLEEA